MLSLPPREFLSYVIDEGDKKAGMLLAGDAAEPRVIELFRKLERLGLLTDEALFSLLAQAPVDPYGIFSGLRQRMDGWQFDNLNFSMLAVLAKKGDVPVAAIQVDLLSDDVAFLASRDGKLSVFMTLPSDHILIAAQNGGDDGVWAAFKSCIDRTVAAGMKDVNQQTTPEPPGEESP